MDTYQNHQDDFEMNEDNIIIFKVISRRAVWHKTIHEINSFGKVKEFRNPGRLRITFYDQIGCVLSKEEVKNL